MWSKGHPDRSIDFIDFDTIDRGPQNTGIGVKVGTKAAPTKSNVYAVYDKGVTFLDNQERKVDLSEISFNSLFESEFAWDEACKLGRLEAFIIHCMLALKVVPSVQVYSVENFFHDLEASLRRVNMRKDVILDTIGQWSKPGNNPSHLGSTW